MKPDLENSYPKKELTLTAAQANMRALVFMLPILLLYVLPYVLLWHGQFSVESLISFTRDYKNNLLYYPLLMFLIVMAGTVVHELLHGIMWSVFCRNGFRSVSFGIHWKALTPYCHCKEPLLLKHYLLGGLMPGFILGLLPALYGVVAGEFGWWLFGLFFTLAAAGDLLIAWMLRHQSSNDLVQDHPEKIGCYILKQEQGR